MVTSPRGNVSVLVLRMYNETIYGEYKCTAKNLKGEASIVFHVTEGNKPNPPDEVSLTVLLSHLILPKGQRAPVFYAV